MSQEVSYSQVQRIREIAIKSYTESVAQVLSEAMHKAPVQITAHVQKIMNVNNTVISPSSVNILQSPTSLKVLQKHFNQNIAVLNLDKTMKTDEIAKIKAAALVTLQQENLKIENKALVKQAIQELMTATTLEQTTEKLFATFAEIKNEHTKVFTNTLSSAIRLASSKIGFNQVKLETVTPTLTRIVATNPKGINLISEIHTDAHKKVDILSESEGITDDSCEKIMDDFNNELLTFGIVAERKERKPTGGIAQLPYAKKLQKQRRTPSKREFVNEQVITKDNKSKAVQYINN